MADGGGEAGGGDTAASPAEMGAWARGLAAPFQAMLAWLRERPADLGGAAMVAEGLRTLARCDGAGGEAAGVQRDALVAAGAFQGLRLLLERWPEERGIVENVAEALCDLVDGADAGHGARADGLLASGALEALLQLLDGSSYACDIRRIYNAVAGLVGRLASGVDAGRGARADALIASGVLWELGWMISRFPWHPDAGLAVATALRNVAHVNDAGHGAKAGRLLQIGTVEALLQLLKSYGGKADIVLAVLATLRRLASIGGAPTGARVSAAGARVRAMVAAGAVRALRSLLAEWPEGSAVAQSVSSTLTCLAG